MFNSCKFSTQKELKVFELSFAKMSDPVEHTVVHKNNQKVI